MLFALCADMHAALGVSRSSSGFPAFLALQYCDEGKHVLSSLVQARAYKFLAASQHLCCCRAQQRLRAEHWLPPICAGI